MDILAKHGQRRDREIFVPVNKFPTSGTFNKILKAGVFS
jgi:hypothetical protein